MQSSGRQSTRLSSFWSHQSLQNDHRSVRKQHSSFSSTMASYLLFGALHELSHAAAMYWLLPDHVQPSWSSPLFWYQIFFERRFSFDSNLIFDKNCIWIVRHAGWISSLVLAILVTFMSSRDLKYLNTTGSTVRRAAWITAVEALSTDLLGLPQFMPTFGETEHASSSVIFFCGNFGVILLHHQWLQDRGKHALDCLEQMVHVTMMRGAQSGGVVTFQPTSDSDMKGLRSRVVNKKRTDLSKEIRSCTQLPSGLPKDFVPILAGHTRFATSSLSTLDGTHPHRWTPGAKRRVYFLVDSTGSASQPQSLMVENFITHNGDFDFYRLRGQTYDIDVIQKWLGSVTGVLAPASVDSVAIAGMIDLIRCQGCFGLAARYVVCLDLSTSYMNDNLVGFPDYSHFEKIANVFENCLALQLKSSAMSMDALADSVKSRALLAKVVTEEIEHQYLELLQPLSSYIVLSDGEEGASIFAFCILTVNAFFDNDSFQSAKIFLKHAKGSFGLVITSTLDAHRQIVIASRGQTMSIGFFPDKGLICYGSEQAAVKAGLSAHFPGEGKVDFGNPTDDIDLDSTRLDLDDLGGEIVVVDWGRHENQAPTVSKPNRHLVAHRVMNQSVEIRIHQEFKSSIQDGKNLYHRLTRLTRNELITPLKKQTADPVLTDIQDIPQFCKKIQDGFHSSMASIGLNRLTAFHLATCLRARLDARIKGRLASQSVDIVLTGCEVSLWMAEQFASDLKKCFPKLAVQSISSNKLLGLYGQEISIPSLGFPHSTKTTNYNDAIVIIVSHSGGTFAPLACSNLLQSSTKNIFVVTGDWDTQIGKNLRMLNELEDGDENLLNHRIFTTDVGIRPAEPCSLSVAATHQLLTNLLEYISVTILSDPRYARVTGAAITATDIQVLERCNQMNIEALSEIVGVNVLGYQLDRVPQVLVSLRQAGDLWSEHILENARAYIMSFVYIFATVTAGYPLVYAIAFLAGMSSDSPWAYPARAIDAAIYFWLPQICITILRLYQRRNLLHRMVGRTVVIGDIPWVAQSAEAFLSKLFAVSYSIAGLNVLSGNPTDHLVHRHTHRVVRGTLAIFGRPDGRLSALSTAEASVCLAVNQASSIQSRGGTCESVTIGHNPFKLDLSLNGIFLKRHRPLFLCERLLVEIDASQEKKRAPFDAGESKADQTTNWRRSLGSSLVDMFRAKKKANFLNLNASVYRVVDCSVHLKIHKLRSAPALLGAYLNIDEKANAAKAAANTPINSEVSENENPTVDEVVQDAISNRKYSDHMHRFFASIDRDRDGFLSELEFVSGIRKAHSEIDKAEAVLMFRQIDTDGSGKVSYAEFTAFLQDSSNGFDSALLKMPPIHRDARGIIQIEATKEKYFGDTTRKINSGKAEQQEIDFELARSQHLVQELYETRVASMQRFVSMTVMFHHMAKRVESFFDWISFGMWSYRFDRTHSIMRIATTASPVSGADVRQRMAHLRLLKKVQHSVAVISTAYLAYKHRKDESQRLDKK